MSNQESIIWAVDPTEEKLRPSPAALASIRHLLGGTFAHVHPVYICADEKISLEDAQRYVNEYLQPMNLGPLFPPQVYRPSTQKRSEWAERVLNLAYAQKAKLILLTSHGRSSVGAFFIGSFVREIIQKANIPVLVITSKNTSAAKDSQALFATDFSESSKKSFLSFLELVQGRVSEVILCHVIGLSIQGSEVALAYGGPVIIPEILIKEQTQEARVKMKQWLQEARATYKDIDFKENILHAAVSPDATIQELGDKEHVGLIGVAAHTGPLEGLFFGSVTQALIASQKFNLLISGPNLGNPRFGPS